MIMIIDLKKLGRSFRVAFSGIKIAFKEENTFKAGVLIALVMVFLMLYFPLLPIERAIVVFCIFLVLSLELMNTQVERVTNLFDTHYNREIRAIKDLAASAVLLSVIGAGIVGGLIFIPYIFHR